MRDADRGSAAPTQPTADSACRARSAVTDGRLAARLGLLCVLVASFLALSTAPAPAAYLHTTVTGEYGKEGPTASGTGNGCNVEFHDASNRIYFLADGNIYGLERTAPGTVTPLGGSFPINAGITSFCGDRDLAVDNSAAASSGNIYATPSNTNIYGWGSGGSALSGFPISVGGETCGVAVNSAGQVWGGNYSGSSVAKYTAAGAAVGTFAVGFNFCKLAIDPSNDDLYVAPYSFGVPIWKYTAASGYATKIAFPSANTNNPGIAINGAANRIYVANGSTTVRSYDTSSGILVEEITPGGGISSVAVEESTDTLFVAPPEGVIKEVSGAIVPDVTTEEPLGNVEVGGFIDPAGGGEVTECYFEFGESTAYGSKQDCAEAIPFNTAQNVSAELSGLVGETTYHYRLVAANANGKNFGSDKTITPHYVQGLLTDPADNITRTSAKLKAHFTGNGEETKYYFEWGTTTAYGNQSHVPPGESVGSPTELTNLSFDVSGLQPDTEYHYRVVASNPQGNSPGNDRTFKTLPAVQSLTTLPASDVGARFATLHGSYEGDGDGTTYHFEYGKTISYGSTTPVQNAGAPTGSTPLSADITGLELETTYHYRVVATNSLGTTKGPDMTFTTNPAVAGLQTLPASNISQEGVQLNAEFEGNGDGTTYYFEYGLTTAYGKTTAEAPGDDAGSPTGLTPLSSTISDFEAYTTYHYRVVATNSEGTTFGDDMTFETLPAPLPEISGEAASNITPTSATLQADINPNRWATVYAFEYGPSSAYGETTEISSVIGNDQFDHSVDENISNLEPGTVYHFRVVAINFSGTAYGPDQTFVTPAAPQIIIASASATGQSSVNLSASVNPKSSPTSVRFEYGPTPGYGSSTAPIAAGSGFTPQNVGADIGGLAAGTTYHFRVVAQNAHGTTVGSDQIFTTLPGGAVLGPTAPPRRCRKGFVKRNGKCIRKRC
ncbi:MAG TPA: hypothetical protein VFZ41_06260, partial [Solirubrobacterales bacterium]